MTPTDQQLKQALAKMLPDVLFIDHRKFWRGSVIDSVEDFLCWKNRSDCDDVLDTELLHLCWLVEESLIYDEKVSQLTKLEIEVTFAHSATWQNRTIALCKVKGVEIV